MAAPCATSHAEVYALNCIELQQCMQLSAVDLIIGPMMGKILYIRFNFVCFQHFCFWGGSGLQLHYFDTAADSRQRAWCVMLLSLCNK
jgi:hypothetical protein